MTASLDQLLEDGVIDEVLARLKSGKEADVWLVRHRSELIAAKVYKDRATRSFKNSSGYKEGRAVRNTRTQRAMDKGSKFGQDAAEDAWKSAESDALSKLYAQGVRVPAPVLFYEGILLMELVLDEEGQPAPRLIDAHVPLESAGPLYEDLRQQAVRMLCCDLIHGDLSPYNVLLGAAGPTIIDFPQVVGASHNSQAESFFTRDIENLRTFFAAADPALLSRKSDAAEIWRAYVKRDLSPDFVPTGRLPDRPAHHRAPRPEGEARRHGGPPAHAGAPRQHHAADKPAGPRPQGPRQGHQGAPGREGPRPPGKPHEGPRQQHGRPHDTRPHADGKAHEAKPHGENRPHAEKRPHEPRPHQGRPHESRPRHEPRAHGDKPHGPSQHSTPSVAHASPAHPAPSHAHGTHAHPSPSHAQPATEHTPPAAPHAPRSHPHGPRPHAPQATPGSTPPQPGGRPNGDRGHRPGPPGGPRPGPPGPRGAPAPVVERVERRGPPQQHRHQRPAEPRPPPAPREPAEPGAPRPPPSTPPGQKH